MRIEVWTNGFFSGVCSHFVDLENLNWTYMKCRAFFFFFFFPTLLGSMWVTDHLQVDLGHCVLHFGVWFFCLDFDPFFFSSLVPMRGGFSFIYLFIYLLRPALH
jgi:hypothetical protein